MRSLIDANGSLRCPLGCGSPLRLIWSSAQDLALTDDGSIDPALVPSPYIQSWTVECEDGHVVLIPDSECNCPDESWDGKEPCPHGSDHDFSDEFRTFRTSDAARLKALLERMPDDDGGK